MARANLHNLNSSFTPAAMKHLAGKTIDALYVHVPFCVRKCEYCDFYSLPTQSESRMRAYVDAILQEAAWWRDGLGDIAPIDTIFFGGGTPTLLPSSEMRRLLTGLRERLSISPNVEWSVEANPATVDGPYCRMLRDSGANRLSIGTQSFVEEELKTLGRVHDSHAAQKTVQEAREAGIGRVSVDLIYAVPGQTLQSWEKSLQEAMSLGLKHVSCYCLTLEEQTPMWRLTHSGQIPEVQEQLQLEFMRFTREFLTGMGLIPYEISNYAMPGEECRHNLHYWRCENYLGLGPAAASHVQGERWRNRPNLDEYIKGIAGGQLPVCDVETLSVEQRIAELTMLMLRMRDGIDCDWFERQTGASAKALFHNNLDRLQCMGLLVTEGQQIRLTDRGVYVADEVITELLRETD